MAIFRNDWLRVDVALSVISSTPATEYVDIYIDEDLVGDNVAVSTCVSEENRVNTWAHEVKSYYARYGAGTHLVKVIPKITNTHSVSVDFIQQSKLVDVSSSAILGPIFTAASQDANYDFNQHNQDAMQAELAVVVEAAKSNPAAWEVCYSYMNHDPFTFILNQVPITYTPDPATGVGFWPVALVPGDVYIDQFNSPQVGPA